MTNKSKLFGVRTQRSHGDLTDETVRKLNRPTDDGQSTTMWSHFELENECTIKNNAGSLDYLVPSLPESTDDRLFALAGMGSVAMVVVFLDVAAALRADRVCGMLISAIVN